MKKKMILVALITCSLFLGGVSLSFASVCTNASVENVGAKSGSNAIFVKKTAASSACTGFGTGIWVVLDAANADAMLATALTAMSLGKPVTVVNATGDFVNQGTIIEIYVAK